MEVNLKDIYDFRTCTLRYRLKELGEVTVAEKKNENREIFFALLRWYYSELQDGRQIEFKDLSAKLSQILANRSDYSLMAPGGEQRKREIELIRLMKTFWDYESKLEQKVIGTFIDFRMPFSKDFAVRDQIPLIRQIDGLHELVIFKIGRNYIDSFWLETDISISLYAMAYQSMFKKKPDRICVYHIPSSSIYYTERKTNHFKRMMKSVTMMEKIIKNGDYFPQESMMCSKCPARFGCLKY